MTTQPGVAHGQEDIRMSGFGCADRPHVHHFGLSLSRIQRWSGYTSDFEAFRNLNLECGGFSLHHRDICQNSNSHFRFTDGNERFRIRQEPHFARSSRCDHFARCPPNVGRLSGDQGRFDRGVPVFRLTAGDHSRVDIGERVLARYQQAHLHTASHWSRQAERSAPGVDS